MNMSQRRARGAPRVAVMVGAAAIALFSQGDASAQSKEELDKARALFREGLALSAANNCAGALVKFKAVAAVKMTPQVAFNIAECEEKLGKLLSALGNYRLAASAAAGDKKAADVAVAATPRIAAIEERLPKLTIARGKGAEAAVIELDGTELGATQVGTEMPVDPGPHYIVAKLGNREIWKDSINVPERDKKTVEVVVKDEPAKSDGPNDEDTPPPPPPPPPPPSSGPSIPGIVLTGIGVAGIGAGLALFFGPRQSTIDDLDALCGGDTSCPPSAKETADRGRLFTGIAEAAVGVGAASLITGVILLATSGSKKTSSPAQSASAETRRGARFIGAAPGANLGGVSLVGRF
ncbi:hypothetical protein [Polyangium sp. 15x6]|uniref:hypothetical protein n=1 Tax=Polyangium sp. 15x6 TaxID=3042687 RepID=UPI00249B4023|nr:hypothetical protein [Polyangium sp. 15x6]MDI3281981.1 hypothetical protein [Polyangium sp. 15x6]